MARNVFGFGPMGVAPDAIAEDPKAKADSLALRHNVPANVLLALKEAGSADLDTDAAEIGAALKFGATLDQALGAKLGDPARAGAVMNRAYDIADELYPRPVEPKTGNVVTDTARQLGGSLVKGAGALVKGIGIAAEEAVTGGRGLPEGDSPTWARQGADALGQVINDYGQSIQNEVSDEGRKALAESSPGGDLFDPSTWTFGEKPSLRGYTMLASDVLGSFLPVVATAVLTRSPTATAAVGGFLGGGTGAQQAEQIVDEMAAAKAPDGRSQLEVNSAFYRDLIARGASPDEALKRTKQAASRMAFLMTAPVSAFGGAATERILGPVAKGLAARGVASRVAGTAGLSAVEEGVQEVAESAATRAGVNQAAGTDLALTEGTFADFLLGALGGAVPGAAVGAFARPPREDQDPGTDGSGVGQAAAPTSPPPEAGAAADQIDPLGAAPAPAPPPTGPLSRAAAVAPDMTPVPEAPEAPPKFPDQKPGKPVRVADPQGRIWDAVFQRETPEGGAVLRIAGEEITLDAVEFDGAVLQARMADEEAKMKAKGKTVPDKAPTATPDDLARPPVQPGGLAAQAQAGIAPPAPPYAPEPAPKPGKAKAPLAPPQPATPAVADADGLYDMLFAAYEKGSLKDASGTADPILKVAKRVRDAGGALTRETFKPFAQEVAAVMERPQGERARLMNDIVKTYAGVKPDAAQAQTETSGAAVTAEPDAAGGAGDAGTVQGVQPVAGQSDAQPAVEGGIREERQPGSAPDGEAGAGDVAQPVDQAALTDQAAVRRAEFAIEKARSDHARANLVVDKTLPGRQAKGVPLAEIQIGKAPDGKFMVRHSLSTGTQGYAVSMSGDFATQDEAYAEAEARMVKSARSTIADPNMSEADKKAARKVLSWLGVPESPEPKQAPAPAANETEGQPSTVSDGGSRDGSDKVPEEGGQGAAPTGGVRTGDKGGRAEDPQAGSERNGGPGTDPGAAQTGDGDGAGSAPDQLTDPVTAAAAEADPDPTPAQAEAGNYKKGHIAWNGLDLTIETAKGSERRGVSADGQEWSVIMPAHYGYIRSSVGADGEQVDFYMGPRPDSDVVVVVDQVDADTGAFDEHKAMLGFRNRKAALDHYVLGFSDGKGKDRLGGHKIMTVAEFKEWLEGGDLKKPVSELRAAKPADTSPAPAPEKPVRRRTEAPEGSTEVQSLDGYAIGDEIEVPGRTIGTSRIKSLWTMRSPVGLGLMKKAEIEEIATGKLLDVLLLEIQPISDPQPEPAPGAAQDAPVEAPAGGVALATGGAEPTPAPKKAIKGLTEAENAELADLEAEFLDLLKNQTNSGLDPKMVAVAFKIGTLYVKAGTRRFRAMIDTMMDRLGLTLEQAQPYARNAYNQIRDDLELAGEDIADMDSSEEVVKEIRKMRAEAAKSGAKGSAVADAGDTIRPAAAPEAGNSTETGDDAGRDGGRGDAGLGNGTPGPGEAVGPDGPAGTGNGGRGDGDGRGGERGDPGAGSADADAGHLSIPAAPPGDGQGLTRSGVSPGNFEITDDFGLGEGTPKQKIDGNLAAIRLVKDLDRENRYPTRDEQAALARYVGWGGLKGVFDGKNTLKSDMWGRAQQELRTYLTPDEYQNALFSVSNAHYTAKPVVDAMWRAMRHFGFEGGRALEPTVGTGNFLGAQPQDLAGKTEWFASELDPITSSIAAYLYPEATVLRATGFEKAPFRDGAFDIAIGNPPFGAETIRDKDRPDISGLSLHNYIIAKTGKHLRPGGIMAMVVTHRFLDTPNPQARNVLAKQFRFMGAVRLPSDAFLKNAGTEVTTDIVFFQKLAEGENPAPDAAWLDTDGRLPGDIRVNRYFAENPQNILGRSAMDGTMYGAAATQGEYTVHSDGRDLSVAIDEAVRRSMPADALGGRAHALEAAIAAEDTSGLPIGGMQMLPDGTIIRRELDRGITTITADSFWAEDAEEWNRLAKALTDLRDMLRKGKASPAEFVATHDAFFAAKDIAYLKNGKRATKPSKAVQAVYDIEDGLRRGDGAWQFDAQLAEITKAAQNRTLGDARFARLKGLLDLRRKTQALIRAEFADSPDIEAMRKDLDKAYDAFVEAHGYVNSGPNVAVLKGDTGAELGLEAEYSEAMKETVNGKTEIIEPEKAKKSRILSSRVNRPKKDIVSASSPEDALVLSMQERGRVDLGYMAALLRDKGLAPEAVRDALSGGDEPRIFLDPETDQWTDAEEYLSGNFREKLLAARRAGLVANMRALEKAQPAPMPRERITPAIRSQWIPVEVFEAFLQDIGIDRPKVSVLSQAGMVTVDGIERNPTDYGRQFQNPHKSLLQMFTAAVNGKSLTVFDTIDKKPVKNEEATREVNAILTRMGKEFQTWAYADASRAESIVDAFNEKVNVFRRRTYDGEKYLKLVGANTGPNGIQLIRTQKNAAWRLIQQNKVLLDHVVGAGKTFTMVTGVMERRRLGLTKKALLAVPNHLVLQWARDWLQLYPGARLLAATKDDFEGPNRRRLFARMATGDYDAIIIGHSSLGFIAPPEQDVVDLMTAQVAELQDALDQARQSGEKGRTMNQLATKLKKYRERLERLLEKPRDTLGFDLAEMGVDYLGVDEAHEFKNLEYATGAERLVGMNDPQGSKRAFDLLVKTRGIQKRGGATHFATGTPVSNSLVEAYAMMKYLAWEDLEKLNISNFDAWSAAFVQAETRFEYTATQKLKERNVMSGLVNLGPLADLYRGFADVVDRQDLERIYAEQIREQNLDRQAQGLPLLSERFPTPHVKDGGRRLLSAPPSDLQELATDYYVARMAAIKKNAKDKEYARIDNPLWVLSDARKSSLDIRLLKAAAGEPRSPNSKVSRASTEIKRIYDKWDADKGTQIVFSDLSTPTKTAEKNAGKMIRDLAAIFWGADEVKAKMKAWGDLPYTDRWAKAVEAATSAMDDPLTDDDVREKVEAFLAGSDEAEGMMVTADTGFSVYDDLRAALVEKGIPEREIAFIHDFDTPEAKAKLFKRVKSGAVRVLIGSTPKMGAGTNVQERVVALHHIDSPWRPSDVEQREGRVIRRGNELYKADPDGFEVEILAYSTTGTSDVVLWQVLERKARSIGMFKAGAVDRLDEGDGDADSFAEFMATSTGNPVFRLKMQAEKALLEESSRIAGALLAKSGAQNFLRGFDRSKADLEAAAARLEKIDPSALDYQGTGGPAAEFKTVLDQAKAKYDTDMAAFDAFRARVEARKIELAATGLSEGKVRAAITKEFGDEAKENQKPAKPGPLSDAVTAASGWARAIKKMLTEVDATTGDGQRVARLRDGTEVIVAYGPRTSTKAERLIQVYYRAPGQPNPRFVENTYSINASGSARILSYLMPDAIAEVKAGWLDQTKTRIAGMETAKPEQERIAALDVDETTREEIRSTLDYYAMEVKLAEAKADVDRAKRGQNIFIMTDTNRPLDDLGSTAVQGTPTFAIDGDVFTGTGLGARIREIGESPALFEVTSEKTGQRALVVAKKEGTGWVSERLVKPTPRAIREMAAAKESRFGRAASNRIEGTDIRPLTTALTTEMRRHGLAGRITPVLVRNLINEAGIPIAGRQQGATVTVSEASGDVLGVMRHEIIHALRDPRLWDKPYGLFAEAEWKALVRAARSDKALMARVDAAYPDLPTAAKTEEAVAEMYRQWAAGREIEGPVLRILGKIRRFLRAMAAALRGQGFVDAELVMEKISRGEVGSRGPDGPQGPSGKAKDGRPPAAIAEPKEMRLDLLRGRTKAIVGQQWKKTEGSYWSDMLTTAMAGSGGWNTLALVPGRALFAELGKNLLAAKAYLRGKEEMDALRNQWHARADEVAQEWMTLRRSDPRANDELMDLMHQTTLDGIDPSKPDTWQHAMAGPAERNIERLGDKADQWAIDTMKQVRQRRAAYASLKERYDALPKPFQDMYRKVRAEYDALGKDFERAVIDNIRIGMEIATKRAERAYAREMERIRDEGLEGDEKKAAEAEALDKLNATKQRGGWAGKARMAALRQSFESNRLKGPYFPLARFGEFFVTERDSKGAVVSFSRFETAREQRDYAAEAEARNPGRVQTGVMSNRDELKGSVDPRFVADVEALLSEAGAGAEVMDAVWQRWLETLPDRSIRNSRIHRKGREGFSKDAFRAFGKHMFHGAHQLAKLKFGLKLEEHLNDAEDEARRAEDPSRAGLVVNEMRRRHDFTMNPTGSAAVASLSSLAFIWYLGASPAAAIANISQTTVVGIPIMAARFQKAGVTGVARALTRAARDFAQGRGSIETAKTLTADEVLAIKEALRRGTIDKTQAHDLASVAETGIEYSAGRERIMRLIGFFFHHAERFNREVTFMASYRLARAEGIGHADAIDAAADTTWKAHFDYQNCVDGETECLTVDGWKRWDTLREGDRIISTDDDGRAVEIGVQAVNVFHRTQQIALFKSKGPRRFSMAVTDNHKCVAMKEAKTGGVRGWTAPHFIEAQHLDQRHHLLRAPLATIDRPGTIGRDMAALIGWFAAEGWYARNRGCKQKNNVRIEQSMVKNPDHVAEIDGILSRLGGGFSRQIVKGGKHVLWSLSGDLAKAVQRAVPNKLLPWSLVATLSAGEMDALLDAFIKGDGNRKASNGCITITQKSSTNRQNLDVLQAMATILGKTASLGQSNTRDMAWLTMPGTGQIQTRKTAVRHLEQERLSVPMVWCPTTDNGRWIARRNGCVFVTGNTSRPRIAQSDIGKILSQFKNFTINMLWRLFRDTHQALTGATAEDRKEARTQLIGITLSMMAHAGIKGTWGYGLLMMFLGVFFPGGSDDAEEKLQDALLLEGDTPGVAAWNWIMGAALSGIPGHVTGTDLSERIGMPNLWFRGSDRDLEGEDLYMAYMKDMLGPVLGGIFPSAVRGYDMVTSGEWWRGTEAAVPKVVRDLMKSYRFAAEGAETLRGDPLIEEMTPWQIVMQMNGFTPAQLAERYEINNRLKNAEARIMDERKSIHRAVGDAVRAGDPISETLLTRIRDFNSRFPEYPITADTIRQSVQGQIRASDRNEFGIVLNPKLNDRLRAEQPPPVYN